MRFCNTAQSSRVCVRCVFANSLRTLCSNRRRELVRRCASCARCWHGGRTFCNGALFSCKNPSYQWPWLPSVSTFMLRSFVRSCRWCSSAIANEELSALPVDTPRQPTRSRVHWHVHKSSLPEEENKVDASETRTRDLMVTSRARYHCATHCTTANEAPKIRRRKQGSRRLALWSACV